LKTLNKHN
jgi:hypothetical protein